MPSSLTCAELSDLIGSPHCPLILDVRLSDDFDADPRVIPGAFKRNYDQIDLIAKEFSGHSLVIYCQKGLKLSQGLAAMLRQLGFKASSLTGGYLAWRDAGLAIVTYAQIPRNSAAGGTLWVTRQRPKIDRIACPWLIRRFIDPKAKFLFVESSEVINVAERFGATAFDVEGVKFSHRGDLCSFDVMLAEFGLEDTQPLPIIANIVRGADTNRLELTKESAGLLALSLGLSALYDDDLQQLEAGMLLYDSLYAWAKGARQEIHNWSPQ